MWKEPDTARHSSILHSQPVEAQRLESRPAFLEVVGSNSAGVWAVFLLSHIQIFFTKLLKKLNLVLQVGASLQLISS